MKTKQWLGLGLAALAAAIIGGSYWFRHHPLTVLDSKGPIGGQERNLIVFALMLVLIVVIPVFAMTIGFAWRYRVTNKKARYSPNLDGNNLAETAWWLIPTAIISILAIVAWRSSHELDPSKALSSPNPPMTVQVIALQWKWLFIYPQQEIASVNYLRIPVNTPISFEITSDAPMNSFWIPQLGGQIYAMSGMSTQLHLMASQTGRYYGESANISGAGFSGMRFITEATSSPAFKSWEDRLTHSGSDLTLSTYNKLAKPSQNNPITYYRNVSNGLYAYVVNKFVTPPNFTPKEAL